MSIRNFMMNAPPPPPHHRVQTLQAVNVMPQQGQQGSANSNQNGSAPPTHEYHFMSCIPYQTPGAAPAPNLIRHMQSKKNNNKFDFFKFFILFCFIFEI
jgi:hypothetical protein